MSGTASSDGANSGEYNVQLVKRDYITYSRSRSRFSTSSTASIKAGIDAAMSPSFEFEIYRQGIESVMAGVRSLDRHNSEIRACAIVPGKLEWLAGITKCRSTMYILVDSLLRRLFGSSSFHYPNNSSYDSVTGIGETGNKHSQLDLQRVLLNIKSQTSARILTAIPRLM